MSKIALKAARSLQSCKISLITSILLMKGQKKIRLKLHNFYNRWFLVNHIVKNGFTLEMRTIYEEVNASETF